MAGSSVIRGTSAREERSTMKSRVSLVEAAAAAVLVALVTFAVTRTIDDRRPEMVARTLHRHADELTPLQQRYGPGNNSEHGEEWVVRDFFGDKRGGFFVDVGANHYQTFSNTYYLDVVLGWSGIAVEPQTQFAAGYAKYRPRSRFRPFFVSDVSDAEAKLYVSKGNPLVTSGNQAFARAAGSDVQQTIARTITLNDLLDSEHVQTFDFLNMDIELWEPKALAGFDIERFRPAFVCIEAHPEVRQQLLDYFAIHHYTIVGKYLRVDESNLYFAPLGSSK
jgi:FkbM family methyltransferase